MKRATKQPSALDQAPHTALDMIDNTMMDILLDMSSQMQAMEEYVAQQNPINLMGNEGPTLDMSGDHAQLDATTSSARLLLATWGALGPLPHG